MQIIERVLELNRAVKVALIIVLVLALGFVLYPFQSTTAPEWTFQVVDDRGAPVSGINVTEHWQHYLIEDEGHEELKTTDATGGVSFPARTVRASLANRFLRTVRSFSKTGIERRRDAYASVVIWGSKNHELTTFIREPSGAAPEKIVVRGR